MMKRPLILFVAILTVAFGIPALWAGADDVLTIPAGASLQVRLTTTLSTRTNQNGDPWTGSVVEPLFGNGRELIPVGSTVEGRVALVKPPGRATGRAQMRLVPEKITTPEDVTFSVSAGLQDAQGAEGAKVSGDEGTIKGSGKSAKGGAVEAGVDAGVGAGVGAIADGGTGALYGAAIGATAGLIRTILKKHKDIVLPQGTELTFVINRTLTGKKSPQATNAQK